MAITRIEVESSTVRLCACGCGEPTRPAPYTHHRRGWIQGEPIRYVYGHYSRVRRGIKRPEIGAKISAAKLGHHDNRGSSSGPQAKQLSESETAWLAGLIDGEGSIYFTTSRWQLVDGTKRSGKQLKLCVANTHRPLLDRIVEVTGCGHITNHGQSRHGRKDCFSWDCYGGNAISLIRQTRPWLIVKAEKAAMAEDWVNGH